VTQVLYQTDRLILRPWREEDKLAFSERRLATHGFTFWAVERRDKNEFIGFVGLNTFEAELPFCPCVEIGWRLAFDHWGKGFATEAATKCLSLGFSKFGLEEIVSFTALANNRSRQVMTKIGMVNTGDNFLHPSVAAESGLQEHCLYHAIKPNQC